MMARICGICPVSHLIASAKACDAIMAVRIPPTAGASCAGCMNLAQIVQSHALSFFHLSSPDLLLGIDSDPATRNIFGLVAAKPELAAAASVCASSVSRSSSCSAASAFIPAWVVPGGVDAPLDGGKRDRDPCGDSRSEGTSSTRWNWYKQIVPNFTRRDCGHSRNFPSLFLGLVNEDGSIEFYDGALRLIDADRQCS